MNNRTKIIILWAIFLFGMTVHTILALIPIFYGVDIAIPEATGKVPSVMLWIMFLSLLIPMILILAVSFIEYVWFRISNFVLSIIFTIMNTYHLIGHAGETPVDPCQIVLLTFVLISGVMLNIVSYRWMRE